MKKYANKLALSIFVLALLPMFAINVANQVAPDGIFTWLIFLVITIILIMFNKNISDILLLPMENDISQLQKKLKRSKPEAGKMLNFLDDSKTKKYIYSCKELNQISQSIDLLILEHFKKREDIENTVNLRTQKAIKIEKEANEIYEYLQASMSSLNEAILICDINGKIMRTNNKFIEICPDVDKSQENHELSNRNAGRIINNTFKAKESVVDLWQKNLNNPLLESSGEWQLLEDENRYFCVSSRPVISNSKPIGKVWVFQETSNQKALEIGLIQAQKMEAIGKLSGGFAHDFNNILASLIGSLELIRSELGNKANNEINDSIQSAMDSAQRGASIIKQMLNISKTELERMEIKPLNLATTVHEIKAMMHSTSNPKIRIETEVPKGLWIIRADHTQIFQCVMNLCINAIDAIGDNEGNIKIKLSNYSKNIEDKKQEFVKIDVIDDGPGMIETVRKKVFQAFFTTKTKGTGLGLATTFSIVKRHNGEINCESELGKGTSFTIIIPRAKLKDKEKALLKKSQIQICPEEKIRLIKDKLILIADDEKSIRQLAQVTLNKHSAKTLLAEDGKEALDHIYNEKQNFDLIILDLSMPKLSGKEVFEKMREDCLYTPVIICSGSALDQEYLRKNFSSLPQGALPKPYTTSQLINEVARVIEKDSSKRIKPTKNKKQKNQKQKVEIPSAKPEKKLVLTAQNEHEMQKDPATPPIPKLESLATPKAKHKILDKIETQKNQTKQVEIPSAKPQKNLSLTAQNEHITQKAFTKPLIPTIASPPVPKLKLKN